VRSVRRNISEEGFVSFLHLLDPAECRGEEQVGAIAFGFDEGSVVADSWIEVLVAGSIGARAFVSLSDAACSMDEGFVEASLVWLIGLLVTEMPFPEYTGSIAGGCEDLGQGGRFKRHALALQDGMGDTVLQRMPPRHKGGSRGGTGGADQEAREARALVMHLIQVRCLYPWMTMATHGCVPLVIRDDQDDVGLFAKGGLGGMGRGHRASEGESR